MGNYVYICTRKGRNSGSYRTDRDTHQIILKTEDNSSANGGPYKLFGTKLQSRWITKAENPQILS